MTSSWAPSANANSDTNTSAQKLFDDDETKTALKLVAGVLLLLTLVKPLGGIPIVGEVGFTLAAAAQLYLPMWRCDKKKLGYDAIGLTLKNWKADMRLVVGLCVLTFPPYVFVHHLYVTQGHDLALQYLPMWAHWLPKGVLAPHMPADAWEATKMAGRALHTVATHFLGVALPEETFYRGYLQPALERRWPPKVTIWAVPLGRAAVYSCALFALGHFLGEWNPFRLGPFLPALVFAWMRNSTGTVVGSLSFHALCNILGATLFALYTFP